MPQVVTELTGGVASYVARLPTPCVDATEWAKTLDKPMLEATLVQHEEKEEDKSDA